MFLQGVLYICVYVCEHTHTCAASSLIEGHVVKMSPKHILIDRSHGEIKAV